MLISWGAFTDRRVVVQLLPPVMLLLASVPRTAAPGMTAQGRL
jgi:hypothetical protein